MIKHNIVLLSLLVTGAAVYAAPAPVTDVNSGSLEQRLATLERMVGTRTDMQQRLQQQLDTVQDEVNELRGTVELHTHKLEQILERQRELYQEIDKRIQSVMQKPDSTPMLPANPQTNTPSGNQSAVGESQAYDNAVNLILKDKRYDQAIAEFEKFLTQFPNSTYAANAYYWLGQLLFNKQDWSGAEARFNYLVGHYPDSTKRADSLLKLGMIAQKQNNLPRAQQLFSQVVDQYTGSTAAKLADSRLKSLK
ncbi:tol-pal system protein YbgF [Neptunicella sp. SCSIO 80796]|uniref:tol-pal system protein YbgF n=1 Tax=Neptunicella plasticusilytica TaxID=3117012 RepID=UPI003A4D3422